MSDTTAAAPTEIGPAGPIRARRHIPALDGVRGVAILLVLMHHLMLTKPLGAAPWFDSLTHTGWVGVDLFFVLSGFLITGILYDTRTDAGCFRNFIARRVLRIFPLYYGVLVGVLVIAPAVLRRLPMDASLQASLLDSTWQPPVNHLGLWLYLQNFIGSSYRAFGHFWSLAVEEHFYLLWPLVIFRFRRVAAIRVCLGLVVAALVARVVWHLWPEMPGNPYTFTFCRMDSLAIGGLAALLMRGPTAPEVIKRWALRVFALCGVLLAVAMVRNSGLQHRGLVMNLAGYPVIAAFFASLVLLIAGAPETTRVSRLFSLAPLRGLGRISYGIYVYHRFVRLPVAMVLPPQMLLRLTGSPALAAFLFFLASATVSVLVAWLSWRLFEVHFLKLKRFFPYAVPPAAPSPGAARRRAGPSDGSNPTPHPATRPAYRTQALSSVDRP